MTEIAAELGLSRGYVSYVVNGTARRRGLSEKTIERVQAHLAERGYVPSRYACHLRSAPVRVVGIMYVNELFSHLAEGFQRLVGRLGAGNQPLEIGMASNDRVEDALRDLLARRVTDLIWINNNRQGLEQYRWGNAAPYLSNVRTIVYNYLFDLPWGDQDLVDRGFSLVGVNRGVHIRRLAEMLKQLGHRVVALPDTPRSAAVEQYFSVFESVGLKVAYCPPPFTVEGMLKVMKEQGVTAACFHGDSPVLLAIGALRDAGVRVPDDLTVTGFDGMSRSYDRSLTTLVIPVEKMVDKVCQLIEGNDLEQRHCFDLELVEGRTHGAPAI